MTFARTIKWAIGPLLFILVYFLDPFHISPKSTITLAVAALMISWWITEALPMAVVALLPIVLFPLLGIASAKTVTGSYGDPAIFLFLGGFLIGIAIEKWNHHKRIALTIVTLTGTSGNRIILGFILATGILSMWLSNTATTMMMYPIAASVIQVVAGNRQGQGNIANFSLCIMLSIAYASNFGGVATLIGTPPNVAFSAFIAEKYHSAIGFAEWLRIGLPVSLLMLLSLYFVLTRLMHPSGFKKDHHTGELIRLELQALGPLSIPEKRVLIIFAATAFLWITRDLLNGLGYFKLDDTMIALGGAVCLFIVPAGSKENHAALLHWKDTEKVAWGILLLFGGGIALASALEKAGLIESLGQWIAGFAGTNILLLIIAITVVSMFISELMSNIAQVIVFAPVIGGIADALHVSPLLLGIPMTLAASCASMLPMGTPPNAIVFASGHVSMKQMVTTGLVMNIIGIIIISALCYILL